ncbi:MAG: efflux RND transporter periplasmic adaptor subunit [Acidobacteriia bacterium]|nr:efflux RND transporter periplasmic adaptor subunit [Terriglobia bacterium]
MRFKAPAVRVLGVVALALVASACGAKQQQRAQSPVPVTVAKTVRKTVALQFRAIGRVEPIANVAVRARIGGDLVKVDFEEGRSVRAGDTLFVIDPRQYEASLRQAEAQLARDQAMLHKAEEDVKRYADLVKRDFVTQEQYDQMVSNAESLRATVAADQANADNARLQVAYCTIKAPVSGRTGNLMLKVGNLVKANDDNPLVTLNETRPIYVSFAVPAQLLPAIAARRSGRIAVTAAQPEGTDPPSAGTLSFVDNAVDPSTSTILLKATFPNEDERLWPGQFVDVVVTLGEEADRVVTPTPALQTGQQGQYVYVVKNDGTVEMRPVKVARMDESEAVIADGLTAGETVVTDGQLRLVPGSRVEIKGGQTLGGKPS